MLTFLKINFLFWSLLIIFGFSSPYTFALEAGKSSDCRPEIKKELEADIDFEFKKKPKKWDERPSLILCKEIEGFIPLVSKKKNRPNVSIIALYDFAEWNENSGEEQDVTLKIYNLKREVIFLVSHLGVGKNLLPLTLRSSKAKGKRDEVLSFIQGDFNHDDQIDFGFRLQSSLNHEELSKIYFFSYENLRKKIISIRPEQFQRLEAKQNLDIDELESGYPLLTSSAAFWDDSAKTLTLRPDPKTLAQLKGTLSPDIYGTPWDTSDLVYTFKKIKLEVGPSLAPPSL